MNGWFLVCVTLCSCCWLLLLIITISILIGSKRASRVHPDGVYDYDEGGD